MPAETMALISSRLRRGGAFCKAGLARLAGGDSLWSPSASRSIIRGVHLYAYPAGEFVVAFGVAEIMQSAKPVRLAAGAFLLCVRVVAGCAPCRVTPLTLGVTLQRSAAPPFPGGPCVPPGAPYQNTLGATPQDPLTLKLRLDTLSRCLRRILLWILQEPN